MSERCLQRPLNHDAPLGAATIINCLSTNPPTLLQMFVIVPGGSIMTDESVCLDVRPANDDSIAGTTARLSACTQLERQKWMYHKNVTQISFTCLIYFKPFFVIESDIGAQNDRAVSNRTRQ